MRGKRTYVTCARCGRFISQRVGGGPVKHKCEHGRTCVGPAWGRADYQCETCAKLYPQAHAPRPALIESPKGGAA